MLGYGPTILGLYMSSYFLDRKYCCAFCNWSEHGCPIEDMVIDSSGAITDQWIQKTLNHKVVCGVEYEYYYDNVNFYSNEYRTLPAVKFSMFQKTVII